MSREEQSRSEDLRPYSIKQYISDVWLTLTTPSVAGADPVPPNDSQGQLARAVRQGLRPRITNHALTSAPRTPMKFLARAAAKKGELYMYGDIGDSFYGGITPTMVAEALKELAGCTEIDLYMNSDGGDVFAGYAIYSQLARFPATITAHVDGIAASIASVICMAANTITMAKFARMMIHDPAGGTWGSAEDLRKTADLMDAVKADIVTTYADRTKAKPADIAAWMKDETWMDAATCVERGFANSIDENVTVQAHESSPILAKYKHTPADLLDQTRDTRVAVATMNAYIQRTKTPAV